tara:strand:- start:1686 stop:2615 length:930 start_codon:yes stop_codon:yes gene_type:complete
VEIDYNFKNKEILVLGSLGFIGKNLIERLSGEGAKVTGIGRDTSPPINLRYNYIAHDFSVNPLVELKQKKFEYVINCLGKIDHEEYLLNGRNIISNNLISSFNIIDSLNLKSLKKIIHIGSSDEYEDSSGPISESMLLSAETSYSFAKISATYFFKMLFHQLNLPVVILRPFIVYGPGQKGNRLVPYVIKNCLNDKVFNLTEGNQLRDFLFIDDFIDVVITSLNLKSSLNGEIFNIATGVPTSVKTVVQMIQDKINKGTPKFGNHPNPKKENQTLFADNSKAFNLIGWKYKTDLESGLDTTIKSYMNEK